MYIALDGDFVGRKIETLILAERLDELFEYNMYVTQRVLEIEQFIAQNGGKIYLSGGDNILAYDPKYKETIKYLADLNHNSKDLIFSVGVGEEVNLAYLALKYAKRTPNNKIIKLTIYNNRIITEEILSK